MAAALSLKRLLRCVRSRSEAGFLTPALSSLWSCTQVSKAPSTPVPPSPAPAPGLAKRVKKSKQPLQVTKDLGRWKPADDLLLINAVLQVVHPPTPPWAWGSLLPCPPNPNPHTSLGGPCGFRGKDSSQC